MIQQEDLLMSDSETNDRKREVPTFGRGECVYRGVMSNPVTGTDDDLSVYAFFSEDKGFELTIHDDGHYPVDERHTAVWVEPEHVPDLLRALGGIIGDDPVELLAQQVKNGSIAVQESNRIKSVRIFEWFRENGVPYTSDSKSVSNL
jgi:hypothetical protein